jgi:6-phosphogluconolactonase
VKGAGRLIVVEDEEEFIARAAEIVRQEVIRSVGAHGNCRLGLSGGSTPAAIHRRLVEAQETHPLPCNYRMARETLLDPLGIAPSRVHRMEAEADDAEAKAKAYEEAVREPLDLLMLGMGEDGHTASLFPGSALVNERQRRVVLVENSPKPPPRRLTITPRVIEEAREILVLTRGDGKAEALARALDGRSPVSKAPVGLARRGIWLVDRNAARLLPARA